MGQTFPQVGQTFPQVEETFPRIKTDEGKAYENEYRLSQAYSGVFPGWETHD